MLDFVRIVTKFPKKDECVVGPEFIAMNSKDLMIRGKSFYAVWDESKGLWSTDEYSIISMIDPVIEQAAKHAAAANPNMKVTALTLKNFSTKKWSEWKSYTSTLVDNYHDLDTKVIFSNTEFKKEDYISRKLSYPLESGAMDAYNELVGTLYEKKERDKLEWAIGAIISGDSKKIQKFIVLYGSAGSGKSTVLNIIQELFEGYYSVFEAKSLASNNNSFALEAFKDNPLIAIQHDGDLSRIEDNTKLNSIVSHEKMIVNEKFKTQYSTRLNSFLFMGTNKPVRITEAKSGIIRRLIDVSPSGKKIPFARYQTLMNQIQFELGAIAYYCLKKYKKMGESYYDRYKPTTMIGATNDFYNFVEDNYEFFIDPEGVTLDAAWTEYKKYCIDANVSYPYPKRAFKEELKNYFTEFAERSKGKYKLYSGFKKEKFDYLEEDESVDEDGIPIESLEELESGGFLSLTSAKSIFDDIFADCQAQLAKDDESPSIQWTGVRTKLRDIDTRKVHYVRVPENLIVIDFDLKDADGNKDRTANLEAASKWPKTYAEYSKSGAGVHLHYIYSGDVTKLSRIYEEGIEIKVFKKNDGSRGYSSLRRKLTFCNMCAIAVISSGLPLKGAENVVNFNTVESEKALRTLIIRNLNKEYHPDTSSSINFIFKILEDAYEGGKLKYDVTDLRQAILTFAMKSTNQSDRCISLVAKMKFKSKEEDASEKIVEPDEKYEESPIIFFDVEVFPNLFIVCWKYQHTGREQVVKMINPKPEDIKKLMKFRLVGFNNRRYDNHILYAAYLGYSNERLYNISQEIVSSDRKDKNCFFSEAYNLSYSDIYDFASKKQSLKKWEIELGINHKELGLAWDKPVPEELWGKVADYCVNDVVATEAVWEDRKQDFVARQILADISGLTVNDTTNTLTTRLIVGTDKNPQQLFEYTDLSKDFPGYIFDDTKPKDKSMYMGESVGEGGYVYSEPGMYTNVALLDIASMHPHSAIALNIFGPYTKNFKQLVDARLLIKHKDYTKAGELYSGKLTKYLTSDEQAGALSFALKIAINSVYGLTAAKFPNKLRDPRNVDNIVAKRGALFMVNLKHEVQKRGFKVAHIKTDSIKIPDATPSIINFVMEYGKKYGYIFEHEATYQKMCLVNDAVYIAKYLDGDVGGKWTATGTQFQVPYVFKTLFSKEPIENADVCETKSVTKGLGLYLDMNENLPEGEHDYHFVGRVGSFCPILPGNGGGVLLRESDGKYYSVTGTKKEKYDKTKEEGVYRWLEEEEVKNANKWNCVDHSYYRKLVDEAVGDISKYGDFEWFVSDDPVPKPIDMAFMNIPEDAEEEIPFD